MLEESIEKITKSNSLFYYYILSDINFNGHSLINNSISLPKKVINLYLSDILNAWLRDSNTNFTFNNCLFGSVELTMNANPAIYKYSGYGIGFDSCQSFKLQIEACEKKCHYF